MLGLDEVQISIQLIDWWTSKSFRLLSSPKPSVNSVHQLMATTSFLELVPSIRIPKLQSLKWNPLSQTFSTQKPLGVTKNSRSMTTTSKLSTKDSNFSSKCVDSKKCIVVELGDKEESSFITFDGIVEMYTQAAKALQKPVVLGVLLGLLFMHDPHSALAASGGRMGGRSFSSPSSSRSYSTRTASPGLSYSAPYYAPSPFGFGGGGGFYFGSAMGVGAGSGVFLLMMGFAAFVLVSGFLSDRGEDSVLTATEKTSVIKLQVGLLGMARSLQNDLNRIAEVADTSIPSGLSYVLTETTLALLRHPDFCISGYSSVDVKRSIEDGEKHFNKLSIEERGKFDEETLVNVNNIKRTGTRSQRANGFSNEYIVITILVAAEGVNRLPAINGSTDLKEALQKLASIPSSKIMAVEVLWTPQNENDTLTEHELLEDYPLLRPL